MHGNPTRVWHGTYTTATTTVVLGRKEGGCIVREVLWTPLQHGERSDTGRPVIPALINIVVNAVVRATLQEICGLQEDQHGFGWSVG